MANWTFYPAFLATIISVVGLSRIAYRERGADKPQPLSLIAVSNDALLARFRTLLLICGTLFAITMYWFVIPAISHPLAITIAWSVVYVCEALLALIPAHSATLRLHALCAQAMAVGMLVLAYLFSRNLSGTYANITLLISLTMAALVAATFADKKRFLTYELLFIFLSHASILVAVIALR